VKLGNAQSTNTTQLFCTVALVPASNHWFACMCSVCVVCDCVCGCVCLCVCVCSLRMTKTSKWMYWMCGRPTNLMRSRCLAPLPSFRLYSSYLPCHAPPHTFSAHHALPRSLLLLTRSRPITPSLSRNNYNFSHIHTRRK